MELVQFLVQKGSLVNCQSTDGVTPLHRAAELSPDIVRLLLDHGAHPDPVSRYGRTPLHHAASGNLETVRILLALGNEVNRSDNKKNTPLHFASLGDSRDVLEVLLQHGAQVEVIKTKETTSKTCFNHTYLLLAECEVRTASYGPSFFTFFYPFMV